MGGVKWLVAAGLILATTTACTEHYGYPSTSYSGSYYNTGYYNSGYSGYRYGGSPYYASRTSRYGPYGDYDRDGIRNRYDRDANGDGISDRWQR